MSTEISFALNGVTFDQIAQRGVPNAECAEALAKAERIAGERSHVLVRCSLAVAHDLREWFATARRLVTAVGDADRARACADAVDQIDEAVRRARAPRA